MSIFVILTLSRHPAFQELNWLPLMVSFKWPSIVYALDILAWDFFFALAMFFGAPVFSGPGLRAWIRKLMYLSGGLALFGLVGVAKADMSLRNIGIIGYVPVFMVIAILIAILFHRSNPKGDDKEGE